MQHTDMNYDRLAWFYDGLAHLYSGGQIHALKTSQTSELHPGNRVLYVGVGSGEDALLAAKHHASVTILDLSPSMLERAARKFRAAGMQDSVEIICSDMLKHERTAYYDVVVVNFFLNMFPEPTVKVMMDHLANMIKPSGKMLIGDFSYPTGGAATRAIQQFYYFSAMFNAWLFGATSLHPIHDYPSYFEAVNLQTAGVRYFPVSSFLPASFASITAVKA
jgi:demethylmenaquinone methyltransferase/2-methoxy-6-polyprenyl-1,4-benzoquinol methylase